MCQKLLRFNLTTILIAEKENNKRRKPTAAGIKPKVKAIRGSARPIGGLEKKTRSSRRKKNDSDCQPVTYRTSTLERPQQTHTIGMVK